MKETQIALNTGATLRLFSAPVPCKGVVVICPGGGYEWLSPREAEPVAAAFAAGGWVPAVLSYTVGDNLGTQPMRQLSEAVAVLRARNSGLPVTACGFSCGGHLVASLGVHATTEGLEAPDAMILCYPVITAGPYAHAASIRRLTGAKDPAYFSLECHVTPATPPAFLWHTVSDPEVPVQNSLLMAEALSRARVPYELHLFPHGAHGLSLATPEVDEPEKHRLADPHIAEWFRLCLDWLNLTLLPNKE